MNIGIFMNDLKLLYLMLTWQKKYQMRCKFYFIWKYNEYTPLDRNSKKKSSTEA